MFLSPLVAEHMDGWWKGNPAKVGFSCCWSDYLFFSLPMLIVSIVLYVITFFAFGVTSLRALLCYLVCTAEYLPPG